MICNNNFLLNKTMSISDYYTTIYCNGSWKHLEKDNDGNPTLTDASTIPSSGKKTFTFEFTDETYDNFRVYIYNDAYNSIYLQSDGTWDANQNTFSVSGTTDTIVEYDIYGVNTEQGIYFIQASSSSDYYTGPFPPPNANFTPSSSSAVCFLEGTAITTDQGPVAIEQLTQNNTIYGSKVNNITQSDNFFGHLIHFKPSALSQDLPSTDTFLTPTHAIFCPKDKCMKMAKDFCDGENVVEDFTKDKTCKIYNVVCEDDNGDITAHSMYVNNMLCECLHPHAYPLVKKQLKW